LIGSAVATVGSASTAANMQLTMKRNMTGLFLGAARVTWLMSAFVKMQSFHFACSSREMICRHLRMST